MLLIALDKWLMEFHDIQNSFSYQTNTFYDPGVLIGLSHDKCIHDLIWVKLTGIQNEVQSCADVSFTDGCGKCKE